MKAGTISKRTLEDSPRVLLLNDGGFTAGFFRIQPYIKSDSLLMQTSVVSTSSGAQKLGRQLARDSLLEGWRVVGVPVGSIID